MFVANCELRTTPPSVCSVCSQTSIIPSTTNLGGTDWKTHRKVPKKYHGKWIPPFYFWSWLLAHLRLSLLFICSFLYLLPIHLWCEYNDYMWNKRMDRIEREKNLPEKKYNTQGYVNPRSIEWKKKEIERKKAAKFPGTRRHCYAFFLGA